MTILPADPADCFCELWDEFSPQWGIDDNQQWSGQELTARSAALATRILEEGAVPESLRERAARGAREALIAAAAIDSALMEAHPAWRTPDATELIGGIVARYERTRRINDKAPGALLWRFAQPAGDATAENLFPTVTRVPPELWRHMNLVAVPTRDDLNYAFPRDRVVGCVPSAMSLSQFRFDKPLKGTYSIAPGPELSNRAHIQSILGALDASGAAIGLLPECVLDDEGLASWVDEIRATPPQGSSLQWILVGTGPVGATARGLPPNRSVLLTRRTAQKICEQDKRHGFEIAPRQLKDWRLGAFLGTDKPLKEHISEGDILAVVECLKSRYVILVCEDLSRGRDEADRPIDDLVVASSPSFLLVPIFDRELNESRWVDSHSKDWALRVGSHIVVCNSAAVASARRADDLITDDGMIYSAAFWWVEGAFESDYQGQDGGGVDGARVTLYETPLADLGASSGGA